MNRLFLAWPVYLLGFPLLVCLLLTTAHSSEDSKADDSTPTVASGDGPLPDGAAMEKLAQQDPVAFLENCLRRYQRAVKGYRSTMIKQERIGNKLQDKETIEVCFREEPHSVFMNWLQGARKAERALYVNGENNDKMLARPSGALARRIAGDVVEREVDGPDARQSGRYTLDKFGIKKGTLRTLKAWQAAKDNGTLEVKYLGKKVLKEAGDRSCWVLQRTYARPEGDGVTELTIFVDTENWLQIRSVLKGDDGRLIGDYIFRDIQLNPTFDKDQFRDAALKPKP